MQLRPYQQQIESDIYDAWRSGVNHVMVQLATGGGKTALFSKIARDFEGYCVLNAHRDNLVIQISLALANYGVRHNIIAQKPVIKSIIALHMRYHTQSFFDPTSNKIVTAIDTLLNLAKTKPNWFVRVGLVIQDEGHHVLKNNKWGRVLTYFPHAKSLSLTATPIRADGRGLGAHVDGIAEKLITGVSMRQLINEGYLTDYIIYAPKADIKLEDVPISTATGDYSPQKLRTAVHKSKITGDIVRHYLKNASGKLGITFAVSIDSATQTVAEFKAAGVPAELLTAKTPPLLRAAIMDRFRQHKILQLVNVDLLGEGVDVPAVEVISMARPTQSYALYAQQFGRALRPSSGKTHAIIIDHVSNVERHGLPDRARMWSLDRRESGKRSQSKTTLELKTCLNTDCLRVYERYNKSCPFCGFYQAPAQRSSPEFVDGDLVELSADVLARLRGEIEKVNLPPRIPVNLPSYIQRAHFNRHIEKRDAQEKLRELISLWAGYYHDKGFTDSQIYRLFFIRFNIDIATAQTLGTKKTEELHGVILENMCLELNINY
jgi:DNA repair protein RadD